MNKRSIVEIFILAALWGGSFICVRIAVPQFGATALIFTRVFIATLVLIPFALQANSLRQIRTAVLPILLMSFFMVAAPYTLFAYASYSLEVGVMVVINATSPIWTILISSKLNHYRITKSQCIGLIISLLGVCIIVWDKLGVKNDGASAFLAICACIVAAFCYGIGSSVGKHFLHGVSSFTITYGSMVFASILLLGPAVWNMPTTMPNLNSWIAAFILGSACTAVASLLFFRLTKEIGAERAITVTYLQPIFGAVWGALILHEFTSVSIILSGIIVLLATALSTKLWEL